MADSMETPGLGWASLPLVVVGQQGDVPPTLVRVFRSVRHETSIPQSEQREVDEKTLDLPDCIASKS